MGENPGGGVGDKRVCSVWREVHGISFAGMRQERRARPSDDATKQKRVCGRVLFPAGDSLRFRRSDVICARSALVTRVNASSYAAQVDDPLQS